MIPGKSVRVERTQQRFYCFSDCGLCGVLERVEGLNFEFAFSAGVRRIVSKFPSKTLGTRNLTNTAMLESFTSDLHQITLHGTDEASKSTMVFTVPRY